MWEGGKVDREWGGERRVPLKTFQHFPDDYDFSRHFCFSYLLPVSLFS